MGKKSEDWSNPAPPWGVEPAVGVAVAGVMVVPTAVAGAWTPETGVLTPGLGTKMPEADTVTGIGILR